MNESLGRIDPYWAREVSKNSNIWGYNRSNAEEISRDLKLAELGGLIVRFEDRHISPDEANEIADRRSVVNLAFEEDALITSTDELIEATAAQGLRGKVFGLELKARKADFNEAWLFPVTCVELIEEVAASRIAV